VVQRVAGSEVAGRPSTHTVPKAPRPIWARKWKSCGPRRPPPPRFVDFVHLSIVDLSMRGRGVGRDWNRTDESENEGLPGVGSGGASKDFGGAGGGKDSRCRRGQIGLEQHL
jgi:hypothetical protein